LLPLERFLMSQFPPCSGRPGTVRAPSLPTFSLMSDEADPAWTFCGCGGSATSRSRWECVEMSSASRVFLKGDGTTSVKFFKVRGVVRGRFVQSYNHLFANCYSGSNSWLSTLEQNPHIVPERCVPRFEDFRRGRAAENTGVNQTGEPDAGDVARGAEDAFKVPNGFCAVLVSYQLMIQGKAVVGLAASGTIRRGSLRHSLLQRCL
jgi:hypothetical protein